jgi:hypothetical protein
LEKIEESDEEYKKRMNKIYYENQMNNCLAKYNDFIVYTIPFTMNIEAGVVYSFNEIRKIYRKIICDKIPPKLNGKYLDYSYISLKLIDEYEINQELLNQ